MDTTPVVKKRRGISPIWTLPIIALLICIWILVRSYRNAGIEITISFDDASGITPGKTQVIAKGIPVGMVKEVRPDFDRHRILTIVNMDNSMEKYLVKDTAFWVVRPELSAAKIYGLETLVSGSYIGIQTGVSKEATTEFTGLANAPPVPEEAPGLHLFLKAEALGSVQEGSGIYYRNIRIGSVQTYNLGKNNNVLINIYIDPQYNHLVRESSRFSNASGISFSGKLTDLKVHFESVASLLMGGIVLDTPAPIDSTPQAKNGQVFVLYKDVDATKYVLPLTLKMPSGDGIVEGATKVMYRGLDAGLVDKVEVNNDAEHTVTAHVLLAPEAESILKQGTKFWVSQPEISLDGIRNIGSILSGPVITFTPGSGPFQDHFDTLPEAPAQKPLRPGTEFILTAKDSGSLSAGAAVLYKNIQVGEVESVRLAGDDIRITIFIYRPHEHLINKHTVFWNNGGFKVNAGLFSGIQIDAGPLSSIVRGGISFLTPDVGEKKAVAVKAEHSFPLYGSFSEIIHQVRSFQPKGYYFQIKADDLGPFKIGSPILFKKVAVGEVVGFHFSGKERSVLIDCLINPPYMDTVTGASRFFDLSGVRIEGGLGGLTVQTGSLESIVSAGIGYMTPPGGSRSKTGAVYPLYKNEDDAKMADDLKLTIRFAEINDLKVGSPIKYKGTNIGKVTEMHFAEDLKSVTASVAVPKSFANLFRQSTRVWLATPSIQLSGIRNLDTILSGPYITFDPGEGQPATEFTALPGEPRVTLPSHGLNIVLASSHLGSLKVHSPVYYRQIQVGEVTGFELSRSFQHVLINVNIAPAYGRIVRENTRFWNVSGARIEGGIFSGITVSTGSVEAIVAGGIALATPGNDEMGGKVDNGHRFELHDTPEKCWLEWSPRITSEQEGNGTSAERR